MILLHAIIRQIEPQFFIVIQTYYSSLVNPVKEELENVDEEKKDVSWEQIWQDHWATICTEEYNRFVSRNLENEEVQSEASAGDDTKNDEIPAISQEFEKNLTISDEQDRCTKGVTNWLKRINPTADASQSNLSTVSNLLQFKFSYKYLYLLVNKLEIDQDNEERFHSFVLNF